MSHCEDSPCALSSAGMASRVAVAMVLTCLVGTTGFAANSATSMVELADGVYQFLSPDIDGIAVDGNSIAILNERDVLVFETPALDAPLQVVGPIEGHVAGPSSPYGGAPSGATRL